MAKRRVSKTDKWLVALAELSAKHGIALVEVWDGARITDSKSGRELGRSLHYICGLYSAHKPRTGKVKQCEPLQGARDVKGFVRELNVLSEELTVRLKPRSAPVILADVETLEPLGRLQETGKGYIVAELQPV